MVGRGHVQDGPGLEADPIKGQEAALAPNGGQPQVPRLVELHPENDGREIDPKFREILTGSSWLLLGNVSDGILHKEVDPIVAPSQDNGHLIEAR